jgi:putative FmdB family regulatory protein
MPLYPYLCTDCGAATDVFASLAQMEEGIEVACSECGSTATRRALSTIAVRGRGSEGALTAAKPSGGGGGGCCGGGCCG